MNAEEYSKEAKEAAAARIKALPPEEQERLKKMLEAHQAALSPEEREARDLNTKLGAIAHGLDLLLNMEDFVENLKLTLDLDVEAEDELDKRLEIVTSQVEAIMELCSKDLPPNPSLKNE